MSAFIETILQKLLTPDNDMIKHATKQLLEYYVSDKCVSGLYEVLKTSQNPQHKVYAVTLLRKKMKSWKMIKQDERTTLKSEILDILMKETEESVRKQIIWLIASIYKYSVKANQQWPELLKFINDLIVSPNSEQHLFGVYMLSILNEEAGEQMKPHFVHLFKVFNSILTNMNNMKSALYVINSLKCLIAYTNEAELGELSSLLPLAVNASVKIIQTEQNEETVTGVFDFFQSIIEYDIPMISPYIKNLTEMTLSFISDPALLKTTRVCAMNFLNILIEIQKTNLIKNDMIRPIVNSVFTMMCISKDPLQTKSDMEIDMLDGDVDDKDEAPVDELENIFTAATQVLDYCALYFPAKKLIKILIEYVSPAFTSENPLYRRAALAALAITSEGCADYYKNHYLEVLTDVCLKGMQDAEASVVQIAYFALCQFSEFLQPNLTHFANRIINLLIESIETKPELRLVSRLTVRFYDALQSFCENLGDDLEQYLPTLMSKLMTLEVQCNSSLKLLRLIISTFSSIVCSVKSQFNPYFDFAVQLIKPHLAYTQSTGKEPELKSLQIECIDLMAVFAQNIGREKFNDSLIENCLAFVDNTLQNDNDPEMRSAAFELLAGLTCKLKENTPLKTIMPHLIETLKSGEGINLIDSEVKGTDFFSAFDEIDLDDENDDDDEEIEEDDDDEDDDDDAKANGYAQDAQHAIIENEYVSEKVSAILCLQEVAKFKNPQLFEFYNDCFEELKNLSYLSHNDIKKESYLTMAYLISYYHDFCIANLHQVTDAQKEAILLTFKTSLGEFHARSVKAIKHDANRDFIMGVFDAIRLLLLRCALFIKANLAEYSSSLEVYGGLIIDTFKNKIYCQVISKDETSNTEDEEETQAEYDYVLKEYAGEVIPSLAACLPGNLFDPFFQKISVDLFHIMHKSESSPSEQSFVIGVIGEAISNLDLLLPATAERLFSEFYKYMFSNDDEIRSNTIFTIGVLCSQSNNALSKYYVQVITDLYAIIKKEKNKQSLDNVCGSLARMLVCATSSGIQNVDYESLTKTIFDLTPLRKDLNEYHTVFSFILQNVTNKMLIPHYQKIIEISGQILSNHQDEFKEGTKEMVVQFLKFVDQNYKDELQILLGQMKLDLANAIKTHL